MKSPAGISLAFLLPLLSAGSSEGAVIWSEDYELSATGDVSGFGSSPSNGNGLFAELINRGWVYIAGNCNGFCSMSIVPASAGRTGKVLRLTHAEGPNLSYDDSHNSVLERIWKGVPEFYERYYARFEPVDQGLPWPTSTGIGYKQHYINTSEGPANFYSIIFNGGGQGITNQTSVMHVCPPGAGGYPGGDTTCNLYQNEGSRPSLLDGRWHCIETHFSQNQVEMWVDGERTLNYTTGVYYPPDYHEMKIYRQGPGNMYRYEDDHVVATHRIGCGTSVPPPPPPPPTTPPPPPAGSVGTVTNLAAAAFGSSTVNLTFTEVGDGMGGAAKYDVRMMPGGAISWGSAAGVTQGTCASPLVGTTAGVSRTCTVTGLAAGTQYQFQLLPFRGTLNVDAVFGGFSNVASATTAAGGGSTDVNGDGRTSIVDVQLAINQVVNPSSCASADVNGDGQCTITDVQRVVNAALGL